MRENMVIFVWLAVVGIVSLFANFDTIARYIGDSEDHTFCAKMVDGKLIVLFDGNILTSEITLDNGTRVKTDGTVVSKDGGRLVLKEGECIEQNGKVVEDPARKDIQQDNDGTPNRF